jgi:hypothetical protein
MHNPQSVQDMVRRRVRRRRMWRRVRIGLLGLGAAIVVGGAAFGIDRMVVSIHRYYATRPQPKPNLVTTSQPTTTTTAPGPPNCLSAQLNAAVYNWQGTGGAIYETVALTNISGSPCTLSGYPGLGVSAQNGTALPAPTTDVATLGSVPGAPAVSPVALAVTPGTRAWFELSFPDVCDEVLAPGAVAGSTPNACYAGNWLDVTPPGTTSPLLVTEPLRFTYGTAGFHVGPFVAGTPPSSPPVSQ